MELLTLYFAAIAATAVTAVHAAATQNEPLESRAAQVDGHVFICTDGGFSGNCVNYGVFANVCSTFPSAFQDDISSIGPDKGWTCNAYADSFCNDDQGHLVVQNPGYAHLGDIGWNDVLSSISCSRL